MTDKKTEALKIALDALKLNDRRFMMDNYSEEGETRSSGIKAIVAIKEALAEQPAQLDPSVGTQVSKVWWDGNKLMAQPIPLEKLYKEPEQPAQHQEPVAWLSTDCIGERYLCFTKPQDNDPVQPLYTSPQPAQPSKPLTDEQILNLVPGLQDCLCDPWDYNNSGDYYASIPKDMIRLARAIEAAHGIKEKNNG